MIKCGWYYSMKINSPIFPINICCYGCYCWCVSYPLLVFSYSCTCLCPCPCSFLSSSSSLVSPRHEVVVIVHSYVAKSLCMMISPPCCCIWCWYSNESSDSSSSFLLSCCSRYSNRCCCWRCQYVATGNVCILQLRLRQGNRECLCLTTSITSRPRWCRYRCYRDCFIISMVIQYYNHGLVNLGWVRCSKIVSSSSSSSSGCLFST